LLVLGVAGREVHFAGGPGEFVIVHEVVAVERDLLVRAVFAVFGDGVHQELPAELGLLEIEGGLGGIALLELRRGRVLREGGDGSGGGRGVLRPDDLGVAVIGQHVALVFAVLRIDDEVETAVRVLQFGDVIGLVFAFLHDVADAVAALGDAEIVEGACAGNGVGREHQVMREHGDVGRVLAVIAGIVMAAGDVDRALVDEGIELRGFARELRRGLQRIAGAGPRDRGPRERVGRLRRRNFRGRDVTRVVDETGKRHLVGVAAALVIQAQCVGAEEAHRDAFIDDERQRSAHARDDEIVFTGRAETAEVGHEDLLVRRRRVGVTDIGARGERTLENGRAAVGIDDFETERGRDDHFRPRCRDSSRSWPSWGTKERNLPR